MEKLHVVSSLLKMREREKEGALMVKTAGIKPASLPAGKWKKKK